jgi:archaemetzincin
MLAMPGIEIRPIGRLGVAFLPHLERDLRSIFGIPCSTRAPLDLPEEAFNAGRGQFAAPVILAHMRARGAPSEVKVLGLLEEDLYADRLNFIFGQAELPGRWGIVSLYRLRSDDEGLLFSRTLKEAVHELGHTFGLAHCADPKCVMHFSNTIEDTDNKLALPCPTCRVRLDVHCTPVTPSPI